jgi:hypothetical protein
MTHSDILDRIAWTIKAMKRDGVTAQSEFHRYFPSADDKLKFDGFLLSTKDPLAWCAGSVESRYVALVRRMILGSANSNVADALPVPFTDVGEITDYGLTQRLSRVVRCF